MNPAAQKTQSLNSQTESASYVEQLSRVRKLGREALGTPGARFVGIVMLIFAPAFARWFVSGIEMTEPEKANPFTYTVR